MFEHLEAIRLRLSNERARLARAKNAGERAFRAQQVASAEKELAGELAFLGKTADPVDNMTDDELYAELGGMNEGGGTNV